MMAFSNLLLIFAAESICIYNKLISIMKLKKNGIRHLIMLLLLMFVSIAANGQRQIEISYTDGSAAEQVMMADIGRMWLEESSLAMNIGSPATKYVLPLKEIEKIRFITSSTSVKAVETEDGLSMVSVYDLQGRQVLTGISAAEVGGRLRTLPHGVYIVKSKSKTIKIAN